MARSPSPSPAAVRRKLRQPPQKQQNHRQLICVLVSIVFEIFVWRYMPSIHVPARSNLNRKIAASGPVTDYYALEETLPALAGVGYLLVSLAISSLGSSRSSSWKVCYTQSLASARIQQKSPERLISTSTHDNVQRATDTTNHKDHGKESDH